MLAQFLKAEGGAVTVDWVVLAASVVGLGVASVAAVRSGTNALGSDINASLSSASVVSLAISERVMGFVSGIGTMTVTGSGNASQLSWSAMAGPDGQPGVLMFQDNVGGASMIDLDASFTGELSSYYGRNLSFDVNVVSLGGGTTAGVQSLRDVEIVGANGTMLTYSANFTAQVGSWSTLQTPLTQGSLRLANGQLATEAQIRDVLANVTTTRIRVDHVNGNDTTAFDNIRFD